MVSKEWARPAIAERRRTCQTSLKLRLGEPRSTSSAALTSLEPTSLEVNETVVSKEWARPDEALSPRRRAKLGWSI